MMAFKSFAGAVWISFSMNLHLAVATHLTRPGVADYIFAVDLSTGVNITTSGSGISWVSDLKNPLTPGDCDMQGIIRIPFNSTSCYKFMLDFYKPTGFNFHISNGCGNGWGGSSGCSEVHNYKSSFNVYGKRGNTHLSDVIFTPTEVRIWKGGVYFKSYHAAIAQTVRNPTLFTSSYVYFSMNRVYYVNRFQNPPPVGTGFCRFSIYNC